MHSVAEWGFKDKISMFMRKRHTVWWELVITMGWRHKILYIPGSRDTCISYCVTRSIPHPYWPNHVALTHNHHVLNFGTTFYLIQTLNEFTWQNKGKQKPCWYIYSLMFIPSCRCRGMFALRKSFLNRSLVCTPQRKGILQDFFVPQLRKIRQLRNIAKIVKSLSLWIRLLNLDIINYFLSTLFGQCDVHL